MVDHELSCQAPQAPVSATHTDAGESPETPSLHAEPSTAHAAELLGIDLSFDCSRCDASLIVDLHLQGRLAECPVCNRMIEIPRAGAAKIQVAVSVKTNAHAHARLSPEELAFLSELELGS